MKKKQKTEQVKHSDAGKGDSNRVSDIKKYEKNYEKIFREKEKNNVK
tara:strand:+ start:1031 stop:1171 length:141 start_codon:yes stop_codon:yes gene_type:complete